MGPVLAMLLADGRFPAGSHAHSLGLEQAVAEGLTGCDVAAFISARLRLVAEPEARVTVATSRSALRDGVEGALAVEEEWCARCPSPVLRATARRAGRALLRSASAVWPPPQGTLIESYRAVSRSTPRPVALGVVGAAGGIDDLALAAIALYDDAATVASAALKLLPLDPSEASRWVAQQAAWIQAASHDVAEDDRPLAEQPAPAAVGLELAAATHHERRERLFVS